MGKKSKKLLRKTLYWRPVRSVLHVSRLVVLPGFQGVPIFDVMYFFFNGLMKGFINQRAAALSYHFVLALFPLLLFLCTLLPYIPIDSLYLQVYVFIQDMLPEAVSHKVIETIDVIFLKKHGGLMSLGFLTSIYVASSGVNAMIIYFNNSKQNSIKRTWIKRRMISIGLVFAIGFVVILSFVLIVGSKAFFNFLLAQGLIEQGFMLFLLKTAKWTLLISLVYIMFVLLYYYIPTYKSNLKFFSAGATLATTLFILSISGFNFYISHFSHYNALYGSIGALIVFLLWVYMISYILIIGFELNASVAYAVSEGYKKEINKELIEGETPMHISRSGSNKSIYRRWKRILSKIGLIRI